MPKDAMTPRERWTAVLERREPDRIPMDYWATSEATEKLLRHLVSENMPPEPGVFRGLTPSRN